MTVVDYGPCVHTLRRRLEAAEAEVSRLRAVVDLARECMAAGLVSRHPRWTSLDGETQDPYGVNALHEALATLAAEEARRG